MTTAGQRHLRRRLFYLFNLEHGALLWVPSILVAAVVLLWALQIVPSAKARYTQSADFLLILGPVTGLADEPETVAEFRRSLRSRLELQREFHLVPDGELQKRVHAVLGPSLPGDPHDWIRATHNFKARFYLTGEMWRLSESELTTRIDVFEVATQEPLESIEVRSATTMRMATFIADSLGVALFAPQLQRNAQR